MQMASIPKQLIGFGNKTVGRDKLCRFLQYSFRGLSDLLDRLSSEDYKDVVKKFKKLDSNISTARKLLRLGKSLEMIYMAKQAFHIKDLIIQTCVALGRIASACFLFLDHIIWLHRVKAVKIDIKPISKLSNQFWLLSLIINLVRNFYDWNRIFSNWSNNQPEKQSYVPDPLPTALDTVKNGLDIVIPMHSLQYINVPGVIQGLTGAISSLVGIATVWNDQLKLVNI